jgi:hypothetical protein
MKKDTRGVVYHFCSHCRRLYRSSKEVRACKQSDPFILFRKGELVKIRMPAVLTLHGSFAQVRDVIGPVQDDRDKDFFTFKVEIFSVTLNKYMETLFYYDQLEEIET